MSLKILTWHEDHQRNWSWFEDWSQQGTHEVRGCLTWRELRRWKMHSIRTRSYPFLTTIISRNREVSKYLQKCTAVYKHHFPIEQSDSLHYVDAVRLFNDNQGLFKDVDISIILTVLYNLSREVACGSCYGWSRSCGESETSFYRYPCDGGPALEAL